MKRVVLAAILSIALLFCGLLSVPSPEPGSATSIAPMAGAIAPTGTVTLTEELFLPHISDLGGDDGPSLWLPQPGLSWQWQLADLPIDTSLGVAVYDVDFEDVDAATVAALHAQGARVICYVSAGSWEAWRADAGRFPPEVLGNDYEGWPGERWLDIRQIELLAPVMRARLDLCRDKGFDGVEPDNIDAYTSDTGFPLTYEDQLAYNVWFANEAHARGLSIGLKNDDEQVSDLLPYFDWALTEDCFDGEWCENVYPFVAAGKAVFAAEYTDRMDEAYFEAQICPQAAALNFSVILKDRDLGVWMQDCP